jgi:hypothetical protein
MKVIEATRESTFRQLFLDQWKQDQEPIGDTLALTTKTKAQTWLATGMASAAESVHRDPTPEQIVPTLVLSSDSISKKRYELRGNRSNSLMAHCQLKE